MELKNIYCEPYAQNPAPNKTLAKAGFLFVKKYTTIPGYLNFEQEVNQWLMTQEKFTSLENLSGNSRRSNSALVKSVLLPVQFRYCPQF